MALRIKCKTKCPNSLKLLSHISSFRFEEQYGELKGHPKADAALQKAAQELSKIL